MRSTRADTLKEGAFKPLKHQMKIKYSIQLYNTEIDYDKKASTHITGLSSSFMPEYPILIQYLHCYVEI